MRSARTSWRSPRTSPAAGRGAGRSAGGGPAGRGSGAVGAVCASASDPDSSTPNRVTVETRMDMRASRGR
ncbi:hypothetical protein BVG81_007910 [Haliangium sp. UPWRP_2]|nr:hypothetical protein BVG81_007910 [Haliangium sp. UPWRP_2]